MTAAEIRRGLRVLMNYYTDREGTPHALNDAQWAVYLDGLASFTPAALEGAARGWMQRSRWFPALSDLLALLRGPEVGLEGQAHLAWTALERAIRAAGKYRGATFADAAVGETARQVFGSWAQACDFEVDSAGWAIRRQTFLALYPTVAQRPSDGPVSLPGLFRGGAEPPLLIAHVEGLGGPLAALEAPEDPPLSRAEATGALGDIERRYLAGKSAS